MIYSRQEGVGGLHETTVHETTSYKYPNFRYYKYGGAYAHALLYI